MKEYHTEIVIDQPVERVWEALVDVDAYPEWNPLVGKVEGELQEGRRISTFIVPLGRTFRPEIVVLREASELTWVGSQISRHLIAGRHYYRLEGTAGGGTRLLHGEYFTGMLSAFIGKSLLRKMELAFEAHNRELKSRLEQ